MVIGMSISSRTTLTEHPVAQDSDTSVQAPRAPVPEDTEVALEESVYTVTEAARLARVSVQALRQRIQRGTVATLETVRDRRAVTGVARSELIRAYPELAKAEGDLDHLVRGEPTEARQRADELESRTAHLSKELARARGAVQTLRGRLRDERETRARLQGVVVDQERRLEGLSGERLRLEERIRELDERVVFSAGLAEESVPEVSAPTSTWGRGVVWGRLAVGLVVVATAFLAGRQGSGRDQEYAELRSGLDRLAESVEALRAEDDREGDSLAAHVAPGR